MSNLSVVVITKNEEEDIGPCLESVKWADEIVVVDDFSQDRTLEICHRWTDKVFQRKWEGYAKGKNFAIEKASGQWILSLDADERVSPELAEEIKQVLRGSSNYDGYLVPMKFYFFGHWMRYGGLYPKRHLRLFRKGKGKFEERAVHEGVKVTGRVGCLKEPMLHYSYENLNDYLEKFDRYSTLDALDKVDKPRYGRWYPFLRLPSEFILTYFFRQGFRDGFYGLLYSVLNAFYVFVKYMKLWEVQSGRNTSPHVS
ncbi:glycosyltransferase family 2 protein [candidate division NPL-UPA2 bacterium]|nr:glycosyltransferase family 2 protein [candidate division NPL-UPA2 bacterium]